jgi:hypothetical protein
VSNLSVRNSTEFVLYANHEVALNKRWGLKYGVRISTWTNTGEAFEFKFDANGNPIDTLLFEKGDPYITYVRAEPRITIQYLINEHTSLKGSYARNVQNVHQPTLMELSCRQKKMKVAYAEWLAIPTRGPNDNLQILIRGNLSTLFPTGHINLT